MAKYCLYTWPDQYVVLSVVNNISKLNFSTTIISTASPQPLKCFLGDFVRFGLLSGITLSHTCTHFMQTLSLPRLRSMPQQLTSCLTDSQCIMKRRKSPLLCRTKPPIETPISGVLWQRTCQWGQATVSLGWFSTVQTGWQKVKAPAICHCCARVKVSGVGTEGECSWADSGRDRPVWSETQQPVKQESKSGVFWGAKPLLCSFFLSF